MQKIVKKAINIVGKRKQKPVDKLRRLRERKEDIKYSVSPRNIKCSELYKTTWEHVEKIRKKKQNEI